MKSDVIKCPCCGQGVPTTSAVVVSLEENRLVYRAQSIPLTPRLAELAFILARRMPATVAHEAIIGQMWGAMEGDNARVSLSVGIMHLRAALKPIGLDIINTREVGYRLARSVAN